MFSKALVLFAVVALASAGGPVLGGLGYGGAIGLGHGGAIGLGHGAAVGRVTPVYRTAAAPAVHLAQPAIGLGYGHAATAIKAPTSTVYRHTYSAAPQVSYAAAAPQVYAAAPQVYAAAPQVYAAAPQVYHAAPQVYHAAPQVTYAAAPQVHYAAAPQVHYAAAAPQLTYAAAPVKAIAAVKQVAYPPQPYEFGYSQQTEDGAQVSRQESSDAGNNKQGSYSIQNPDGTYRHVEYVADAAGFRASIKTNEHGTSPQSPANVHVLAEEPPYKVLPAAAHSVLKAAPSYAVAAAPIAHAAPVYASAPLLRTQAYAAAPAFLGASSGLYGGHGYAAAPASYATVHQQAIPSALLRSQAGFGGSYHG